MQNYLKTLNDLSEKISDDEYTGKLDVNDCKKYKEIYNNLIHRDNTMKEVLELFKPILESGKKLFDGQIDNSKEEEKTDFSLINKLDYPEDFIKWNTTFGDYNLSIDNEHDFNFHAISTVQILEEVNGYYRSLVPNGFLLVGTDGNGNAYVYDTLDTTAPYKIISHEVIDSSQIETNLRDRLKTEGTYPVNVKDFAELIIFKFKQLQIDTLQWFQDLEDNWEDELDDDDDE